jgi:hypothetical protein
MSNSIDIFKDLNLQLFADKVILLKSCKTATNQYPCPKDMVLGAAGKAVNLGG